MTEYVQIARDVDRPTLNAPTQCLGAMRLQSLQLNGVRHRCPDHIRPETDLGFSHLPEYSDLQRQSADEQGVLNQLTTLPQPDAYRVLDYLRKYQDVALALRFTRGLPLPGMQAEISLPAHRHHHVTDGDASAASSASRSNPGRERIHLNTRLPVPNPDASQQLPSFAHLTYALRSLPNDVSLSFHKVGRLLTR